MAFTPVDEDDDACCQSPMDTGRLTVVSSFLPRTGNGISGSSIGLDLDFSVDV